MSSMTSLSKQTYNLFIGLLLFHKTHFGELGTYYALGSLIIFAVPPTPVGFLDLCNMTPAISPSSSPPDTLNSATFLSLLISNQHTNSPFVLMRHSNFHCSEGLPSSLSSRFQSPVLSLGVHAEFSLLSVLPCICWHC